MTVTEFESFTHNLYAHLEGEAGNTEYVEVVKKMIRLLDEADYEDYFGTQGWKYLVGLED